MGYYDGMALHSVKGSAYEIARVLGMPVILVVPCRGMGVSVLAQLKGFLEFRRDHSIRGILLNRISPALYPRMRDMIHQGLREMGRGEIRVVGYLPEDESLQFESRHLGLVTPEETAGLRERLDRAGELVSRTVDLELLLQIAGSAEELVSERDQKQVIRKRKEPVRVGIARDRAFCFYYPDNLECLREQGCELVPFSPLKDQGLPHGCAGLVLGGGYPELWARELAGNRELLSQIREVVAGGIPCLAECGGFQYLQERLEGADGSWHEMAGVIPSVSSSRGKLVRFGYVTVRAESDGRYLKSGEEIRGHEFHHWDSTDSGSDCLAAKPAGGRTWPCIHMKGSLFAGYPHLYYPSNPKFAARFAEACRDYRREENL